MGKILFLPGGMSAALEMAAALGGSEEAIGASSVIDDPAAVHYSRWEYLPLAYDVTFGKAVAELVRREGITEVYSPHPGVWHVLKNLIEAGNLDLALIGIPPTERERRTVRRALLSAARLPLDKRFDANPMSEIEYAALLRVASTIPGEMDESKIHALASTAPAWPEGDLVEIGSLYGKSAYVLSWLAARFEVGNLLCIDPWRPYRQEEAGETLASIAVERDLELVHQGFLMAMLGTGRRNVNFLRMESSTAVVPYKERRVRTDAFGETRYEGRISVLHIDGNHDYQAVAQDISDWAPRVVEGGWLVIDDYEWVYGDGPRRAADEFLGTIATDVKFVAGGALFVRMR